MIVGGKLQCVSALARTHAALAHASRGRLHFKSTGIRQRVSVVDPPNRRGLRPLDGEDCLARETKRRDQRRYIYIYIYLFIFLYAPRCLSSVNSRYIPLEHSSKPIRARGISHEAHPREMTRARAVLEFYQLVKRRLVALGQVCAHSERTQRKIRRLAFRGGERLRGMESTGGGGEKEKGSLTARVTLYSSLALSRS